MSSEGFQIEISIELIIVKGNWRQSLLNFLCGQIPLSDIFQMVFDVVVFGDMEFLGGFLSFPLGGFHAKTFLKPNYYYYWSSATILVYRPTFLLSPTLQISLPLKKLYFFLLKLHVGGRGKIISTFLLPSALWPPTKYLFIVKHTLTYTSHSILRQRFFSSRF